MSTLRPDQSTSVDSSRYPTSGAKSLDNIPYQYANHGIFTYSWTMFLHLNHVYLDVYANVYAFIVYACWFIYLHGAPGFSFSSMETLKSLWRIHFKTDMRGIGVSNWIGLIQSLRENQWKTTCLMEKHRKNQKCFPEKSTIFLINPAFFHVSSIVSSIWVCLKIG